MTKVYFVAFAASITFIFLWVVLCPLYDKITP